MNRNKVKAFTIIEIAIAMLISAILIGITYASYNILSKSYLSFTTKNKELMELEHFDEWMRKDFDRGEIVMKDTSGIIIQRTDSSFVKYQFEPNFIIRNYLKKDTLNIEKGEFSMSFESHQINQLTQSDEQNRIDEIGISFSYKNENFSYHYYKQYSSANLIERKSNAIH